MIGTCTLFHLDESNRRAGVGFALGLRRIEADVDPRNAASIRALERLGFSKEGLLRERWQVGGEMQDALIAGEYGPPAGAFLLAEGIVGAARRIGYTRLLLDTLPAMKEAQTPYLSPGFRPTAPYRFNPVPGIAFLELDLR